MYRYFLIILTATVALELIMTVRGLVSFDLERLKHRLYFYSYIFLLITSSEVLAALIIWKKQERPSKTLTLHTYVYTGCLFIWSAFVSAIDYVAKGDSGIMVFVMISMAVAVLTRIKPIWFISMMGVSVFGMLLAIYINIGFAFSIGFLTNLLIFLLLACFISFLCYRRGIKELETERKLTLYSITDQLTGIYNRRKLDEYMNERSKSDGEFVFILMDVDDFKVINDTHGHAVGDDCLAIVASRLGEYFGENVFRFGGDEFAIVADMSAKDAEMAVANLDKELNTACPDINLHISAGLYSVNEKTSPKDIFVYADRALYEAKQQGKARCVVYNA